MGLLVSTKENTFNVPYLQGWPLQGAAIATNVFKHLDWIYGQGVYSHSGENKCNDITYAYTQRDLEGYGELMGLPSYHESQQANQEEMEVQEGRSGHH